MGVQISPNVKRTKELIDMNGNVIDPSTKRIIQPNVPDYIPTKEEIERVINLPKEPATRPEVSEASLSITDQIKQAEVHLASLKQLKVEEIARKKKELEELENS